MKTSNLIKNTFLDLKLLYKNFFHWNLSKLIYSIYSTILAFALSLPFLFIILILFYIFSLGEYINSTNVNPYSLISFFFEKPIVFFIVFILSILTFFTFLFGYFYNITLLFNLNLNYIKGKKTNLIKNKLFWDYKFIWKYIKVSSWVMLLLITPFLTFLLGFVIMFFAFGGYESINTLLQQNPPSIFIYLLLILFLLCFVLFLYIIFRVYFSFIILPDEKEKHNSLYYIKKSIKGTKKFKVILKFLVVGALLWLVTAPFNTLEDYYDDKHAQVKDYITFQNLSEEDKANLETMETSSYISFLKKSFGTFSLQELQSKKAYYIALFYIISVFNFLFIYGLFEMLFTSFYKNIILEKIK